MRWCTFAAVPQLRIQRRGCVGARLLLYLNFASRGGCAFSLTVMLVHVRYRARMSTLRVQRWVLVVPDGDVGAR
jgi:hypothetical protein